jgi:hypothetical protein
LVGAVWDTVDRRQVLTLPAQVADVTWLDGDRLVVVDVDGHTQVIKVSSGETRKGPIDVQPEWTGIARAGAGRLAFGYGDGHIDVFDFDGGERVTTLKPDAAAEYTGGPVDVMAASADGTRLYAVYRFPSFGLYEFDVGSGRQLQWDADTSIDNVAVTADAPVAISHSDGTVTLHDPDDLSVVGTLPGTRSFGWVTYDTEGRFLTNQGGDGTIALYDVARRQRMGDPIDVGGGANVSFRPDDRELAIATRNRVVSMVSLDPDTMSEAACHIAGRNLTHAEWDTYIGDLAPYHATCSDYPVPEG